MKNILIIFLLLISLTGKTKNSIVDIERTKLYYNDAAKQLELDTISYPKIRIWHDNIVIELILDSGKYRGSVNYYLYWYDSGENRLEHKKDILTENQVKELSSILINSMNVVEKIQNYDNIKLFPDCGGDMEYFLSYNSYYISFCSSEYNKSSSFLKFIERNFHVDSEVDSLLKKIKTDHIIGYSSKHNCCCLHEYNPITGEKRSYLPTTTIIDPAPKSKEENKNIKVKRRKN